VRWTGSPWGRARARTRYLTPDEEARLLRNALLRRGALAQADIDHEVGEIFGRMALDKALGARSELLSSYDMTQVERVVRGMLTDF
jgi:hypothetical protein